MGQKTFNTVLVLFAAFIYLAEGIVINPLVLWNYLPLFASYSLFSTGRKEASVSKVLGAVCFLVASMGLSIYIHLAWMLNWNQTQTGGSTAALILAVCPVYAIILGGIGYAVGWGLGKIVGKMGKNPMKLGD